MSTQSSTPQTDNSQIVYQVKIEKDPETGDLMLPFPTDMCEKLGWQIGDVLRWDEIEILSETQGGDTKGFSIVNKSLKERAEKI